MKLGTRRFRLSLRKEKGSIKENKKQDPAKRRGPKFIGTVPNLACVISKYIKHDRVSVVFQ